MNALNCLRIFGHSITINVLIIFQGKAASLNQNILASLHPPLRSKVAQLERLHFVQETNIKPGQLSVQTRCLPSCADPTSTPISFRGNHTKLCYIIFWPKSAGLEESSKSLVELVYWARAVEAGLSQNWLQHREAATTTATATTTTDPTIERPSRWRQWQCCFVFWPIQMWATRVRPLFYLYYYCCLLFKL